MRLRVDMEYGLRLVRQLQIFQHVLLFLLLLKLLQLGFPFLLADVQQVLDLLLGIGVFQDQEVGKGVRIDEFFSPAEKQTVITFPFQSVTTPFPKVTCLITSIVILLVIWYI